MPFKLSNKWNKRRMKMRGFFNYVFSLLFLRHTSWHSQRLHRKAIEYKIEKLHIGCGNVHLADWCNIFYEPREEYGHFKSMVNGGWLLNYNLLKPWPFTDCSISFVAGSHVIEHLDLNNGIKLLNEAYRVLQQGGRIRLSCPDLAIYARNYVQNNRSFFEHPLIQEWCAFKQAKTPGEILAAKAYDSGGAHKWFYDFESLKHILEVAGFSNVRQVKRLEGAVPDLNLLELPEREMETVYVEASKAG